MIWMKVQISVLLYKNNSICTWCIPRNPPPTLAFTTCLHITDNRPYHINLYVQVNPSISHDYLKQR